MDIKEHPFKYLKNRIQIVKIHSQAIYIGVLLLMIIVFSILPVIKVEVRMDGKGKVTERTVFQLVCERLSWMEDDICGKDKGL